MSLGPPLSDIEEIIVRFENFSMAKYKTREFSFAVKLAS